MKTPEEVELIRRTNEIAVFGLEAFKEHAVPGKTEVEVMAAVEHAISVRRARLQRRALGARLLHHLLRSGPRGRLAVLARADEARSSATSAVMLELGNRRRRLLERPHAHRRRRRGDDRVARGLRGGAGGRRRAGFAAAKPGATGDDVDAASRAACAAAGFTQFPHHTGHGTGFRYHESRPQLVPGGPHVLSAGNVVITEPGVYGPELNGGVRPRGQRCRHRGRRRRPGDDGLSVRPGLVRMGGQDAG